jgi:hypothetical protein
MEHDEIAHKLGEIAGRLLFITEQQLAQTARLHEISGHQTAMLVRLGKIEERGMAGEARLDKVESDLVGLRSDVAEIKVESARRSAVVGLISGTGISLIAEALRQFVRLKS